jgi:hypothetical protein
MVSYGEASIEKISIHKIGNKAESENCKFSEEPIGIADELLIQLLKQYFLNPFEKTFETYEFSHSSGNLELNEMYHFSKTIFENIDEFHEQSVQIGKHLYEVSNHPKIKSGELYVVYFKQLQLEGLLHDAIGIFKSESKEPYLKIITTPKQIDVDYEKEAINIKKLDKGCIIFKDNVESGFKIKVVDQTNRNTDTVYWLDEFLQVRIINDNYNQTSSTLGIYKDFISNGMEGEFQVSKTDKIDLLNRSIKYFKDKEEFNLDEFTTEVLDNTKATELFKTFKNQYEQDYDTEIPDTFLISSSAVKKQARIFKSVLKLDKNFHIYIHGNNELIEKGTEENGRKFYKLYYETES